MSDQKRRLFIISYRVPQLNNAASSGGLVVALSPFFNASAQNKHFDEVILCGFDDKPVKKPVNKFRIEDVPGRQNLKRALLSPTEEEHRTGYEGYINGVSWPLAHGLIDKIDPDAIKYYPNFRAQSRRFATCLTDLIESPNDLLKIEDYHFDFLADDLRSLGVINKIGHFSHIPKERVSDFAKMPDNIRRHLEQHQNDINRAKLACDLLGFQRATDLTSFKEHIGHFGKAPNLFDVERMTLSGRSTKLGVFPASIDTHADAVTASIPMTEKEYAVFNPKGLIDPRARIIAFGGRADISKNVPNTFDDVTEILKDPAFVRQIQMTQGIVDACPLHTYGVATDTRAGVKGYDQERADIDVAFNRLRNTHAASEGYESATLINGKGMPRNILLKAYRNSVGYFNPWRDGQNLGIDEHVAAQDPSNPNPIVVSREAGAADHLPGALLVDPANRLECQGALKRALLMTAEEASNRYQANMKVLRKQTASHQIRRFVEHLVEP